MTTHDASRAVARLLAALAGDDYDAWHAGDRLVLADALEDLGRDGDAAWVRGLGELVPVYELWCDAAGVDEIRLEVREDVVFSLSVGGSDLYSGVPLAGQAEGWTYVLGPLGGRRGSVMARCDHFGRMAATVSVVGCLKPHFNFDRPLAAEQRRDLVLSRLAAPATPAPFPAPV